MKKQILVVTLIAAVAGGVISAGAAGPFGPGFGMEDGNCGKHGGKRGFARMAKKLNLTDAQQKEVQAIFSGERERIAPLREKIAENRRAIHQAAEAENFDEAVISSLASKQAALQAEIMVSHLKVRRQISAVLTPEQREQAKNMRPMHGKKGPQEEEPF